MKNSPFQGYFWEVQPLTLEKMESVFEFVLVNSTSLPKIKADDSDFRTYFEEEEWVVCFPNLSGDAQLIVPVNRSDDSHYTHLASFVRQAPIKQVEIFWKTVATAFSQ